MELNGSNAEVKENICSHVERARNPRKPEYKRLPRIKGLGRPLIIF